MQLRNLPPSEIYGILGYPLSHTLSPILHNELYATLGIPAIYLSFPVQNPTKEDIISLYKFGVRGLSVTIPHKEWAFKIADFHDPTAEQMKASNTLVLREDGIHAYNTDGMGAVQAITEKDSDLLNTNLEGDILILGSGGSARGIGFAILEEFKKQNPSKPLSKHIILSARNQSTALPLVEEMNAYLPNSTYFLPLDKIKESQPQYIELVIHTTNLGMKGQDPGSILPQEFLNSDMTVFDIVYNPEQTSLIQSAKKAKCEIIYGIDMLIYQGVRQIELFTNKNPTNKSILRVKKLMLNNLPR